jgi:hypothetical protein
MYLKCLIYPAARCSARDLLLNSTPNVESSHWRIAPWPRAIFGNCDPGRFSIGSRSSIETTNVSRGSLCRPALSDRHDAISSRESAST